MAVTSFCYGACPGPVKPQFVPTAPFAAQPSFLTSHSHLMQDLLTLSSHHFSALLALCVALAELQENISSSASCRLPYSLSSSSSDAFTHLFTTKHHAECAELYRSR